MFTRRTFLRSVGGAAATAVAAAAFCEGGIKQILAASLSAGDATPDEIAANEGFWREIQQAFTVDRSIINLNNGGVSPSPRVVQEAMRRYLEYSNEAPTYTMWRILEPQVEGVRRGLAAAFGCDTEEMAITRNASESLEICIFGLNLKPGDEVLTTTQDYPRMLTSWRQRERREGIKLKMIPFTVPPPSMEDLYERFERAITPRTKVILVCHITNLTGQIFPIKRICRLGRERGIEVIVDGAHAFAHFPFKLADLDCDYYGTSLHKWLLAPHGTGFLYVRKSKIKGLWPLMAADIKQEEDIRKFEEIGTHPAANHNAIAEALTFHNGIGSERKAARLRYLKNRWARRLEQIRGVRILTPYDPAQSCGLANFSVEGIDPGKLGTHLWDRYRIVVTPIVHEEFSGIRVTPNVYTTLDEIDVFCEAVEKAVRNGLPA
ncbi:MAG TPA: aminotransferase class V-fold PLP-dependent enzyme [Blastocatellia bacterium]|nr:aminotransferase class V-fold PLP-dependent enzyme [Blastocatellia bacterium]